MFRVNLLQPYAPPRPALFVNMGTVNWPATVGAFLVMVAGFVGVYILANR